MKVRSYSITQVMEKLWLINCILLFVVAANALLAGYSFMSDPSGSGLKADVTLLRFSAFKDFFVPGLVLFVVNGVFNLVAGGVLLRRWRFADLLLIFQGIMLTGWIVMQVFLLREFNILHAVFGGVGIFFCVSGVLLHELSRNKFIRSS